MALRQTFEATALPHMPMLRNYALRLALNAEDANDLVQETYYKAFRFWNRFKEGTNIRGWLCRIMKNSFINQYRIDARFRIKVEYDETQISHSTSHVPPIHQDLQKEEPIDDMFGDEISRTLNSLPIQFRTVLILSDVREHSYAEIAELVECPIGTVRSRLHRGRIELQRSLVGFATTNGYAPRKSKHTREF